MKQTSRCVSFDLQNRRSAILVFLLLFVLVVWVFQPSLQGNFLVHDEYSYVTGNSHVNSGLNYENINWAFSSIENANWHPLTWISHMMDVQFYGLNPWGHHLTSVLIHAFNTVLVFLVFRKMTGAGWRSLMVAGLFGLHPMGVESVAYISERKNVLSTFFWLLAMWTYTRFAAETKTTAGKTKLFYGLTLVFFVMGLMSKTMLVTLPFVFLLLDYWPFKRWEQKDKWHLILEKIPFVVLTAIVSAISYIAQQKSNAMNEMAGLPFSDHLGNSLISYVRYLGKFFWPENLCTFYPHPGHWPMAQVLAAGLFLVCFSAFAWNQRQRNPWLITGWFWYLGTLVPVIGLVQLGSAAMADRYSYVPLIGLDVLLVWGLWEAIGRWRHGAVVLSVAGVMGLAACSAVTRHDIGFWKNDITVWSRAVAVTKDNYVAHDNLGCELVSTQPDAAFVQFKEAVRINPNYATAQRNLAIQLMAKNLLDDAILHFQKSLETEPDSTFAENNLGAAYYKKGQMGEAVAHFQKSLRYKSDDTRGQFNLGEALFAMGRVNEAVNTFEKALNLNPDSNETRNSLALLIAKNPQSLKTDPACGWAESYLGQNLVNQGQVKNAVIHFQKAVQYAPDNADYQCDLGEVLIAQGEVNEATKKFELALHLNPDSKATLNNYAWLLATSPDSNIRNGTRAVQLAQRACELANYKETVVMGTLAAAYAETGRFDDAIATAQKACDSAIQHGEKGLLQKNQELLELYRSHKPYREIPK